MDMEKIGRGVLIMEDAMQVNGFSPAEALSVATSFIGNLLVVQFGRSIEDVNAAIVAASQRLGSESIFHGKASIKVDTTEGEKH